MKSHSLQACKWGRVLMFLGLVKSLLVCRIKCYKSQPGIPVQVWCQVGAC